MMVSLCCPHLSRKNLEEAKNFVSQNKEKFKQLYAFVKNNKKFPDFPLASKEIQFALKKLGFLGCFNNHWNTNKFEENFNRVERTKNDHRLDNDVKDKVMEYLAKALEYQNKYFVFPSNAEWFNNYSQKIFDYYDNI